ncbi:MAG: hypothetical protein SXQ77_02860 [Halobacteria archaeon]|nr:hypothetical protein [Halobacteria archaeon]
MRISETRDLFATKVDFPVTNDEVVDAVGDVVLETPYGEETESIKEVLERDATVEYGSVDELYDTLIGNVGEGHVGRKNYDDRGANFGDTENISF